MTTTYLTVAIPYVNAAPHLGYAYELVLADIHARARRLDGVATRFLGGTDDHSLKNVLAAEAAGAPTREFVDTHAERFQRLAGPLDLSFDDFIRTSADPRHVPSVHRLWNAALASGDLYQRPYRGDYCVGCERFYDPGELDQGGCPEHLTPVEQVEEVNWFFRLSRYQDQLDRLISTGELRITPETFRSEVLAFVRAGLDDISVSRSVARARGWGIPVPNDPSQVIYVWFDALANYLSALDHGDVPSDAAAYRTWWAGADERTHVIGKGILRFHAVYWPAFLLSAGTPLPTHLRVHPYLTVDRQKLSKSSGAAIDPETVVEAFGTDALRWWFARDVAEFADTDFTIERVVARANEDLAGGVGNLVNRLVALVHQHQEGRVAVDAPPLEAVACLPGRVRSLLRRFELRRACQVIVDAVAACNQDLERTQPWRLAREPDRGDDLDALLASYVASARLVADALEPIVPSLSTAARCQLTGPVLPQPRALVPRLGR
jgi:methionyl-tRNA synthetase